MNLCSSFLYLFSNSNLISYFLSSNFLNSSRNPLSIFFIYYNLSLLSSSLTWSINFLFSSLIRWAFTSIFWRSSTFCLSDDAISSIYTRSWPLCSSNIQRTHTVKEHCLQKYLNIKLKALLYSFIEMSWTIYLIIRIHHLRLLLLKQSQYFVILNVFACICCLYFLLTRWTKLFWLW